MIDFKYLLFFISGWLTYYAFEWAYKRKLFSKRRWGSNQRKLWKRR